MHLNYASMLLFKNAKAICWWLDQTIVTLQDSPYPQRGRFDLATVSLLKWMGVGKQ